MNRDVIAGSLTLAVGVATLLLVARLPASAGGTAGAAYFPKLVAYGVLATGAFIGAQGLRTPGKMVAWSRRPLSALVLRVCGVARRPRSGLEATRCHRPLHLRSGCRNL